MTPRLLEVSANSIAKKLQSYQAYLYSNQMNEKNFQIHNVFKMFCHVTYFMHTFITVCYIATLDANLNCLFKLLWRYTLHIKFPLVPRCHVVINLPILMSARQKQHLLGEWWCGVRSLKWLLKSLFDTLTHLRLVYTGNWDPKLKTTQRESAKGCMKFNFDLDFL